MKKVLSGDIRRKPKILKGKLLSSQIATRNTKEKKAGQVEHARKLNANVRVTNFHGFSRHIALVCRTGP